MGIKIFRKNYYTFSDLVILKVCEEMITMTIKEKLQFFSDNGMSISFIARKMNVNPATLSKWLKDEKGITHKNEQLVYETLLTITQDFSKILEE